jgi:hypothetical protein
MILREIVKKIRQIDLRTNRIVTETLAGAALDTCVIMTGETVIQKIFDELPMSGKRLP